MVHGALSDLVERAVGVRGTVMLTADDDPASARWCAVSVAVDGARLLSVGEPRRSLRRWRTGPRERRLEAAGFVHVPDAWVRPEAPEDSAGRFVAALETALAILDVDPAGLRETLVHPGTLGGEPHAGRSHLDHVRAATLALARHGRGALGIGGGPLNTAWARIHVDGDELRLEAFPAEPDAPDRGWAVPATAPPAELEDAASRLVGEMHGACGRDPAASLFVEFMNV